MATLIPRGSDDKHLHAITYLERDYEAVLAHNIKNSLQKPTLDGNKLNHYFKQIQIRINLPASPANRHRGKVGCREVGTRNTRDLVTEGGKSLEEMLDALADRYLRIDCACFTPNIERLGNITGMAKDLKVKGAIHYGLSFCTPYAVKAFKVEALQAAGVPRSSIETDYSMEDVEQLRPGWKPLWKWSANLGVAGV